MTIGDQISDLIDESNPAHADCKNEISRPGSGLCMLDTFTYSGQSFKSVAQCHDERSLS